MDDRKIKSVERSSKKLKHKKHKKHKKRAEDRSKSSDSESDTSEMEWVEASVDASKEKRDEWMNEESFVSTLTRDEMMSGSSRDKRREAQAQKREREEAIHRERELNPHLKNKGSGLPEEEASDLRLPSTSVGDGGYGYLKKAYLRIQEQAQREGRSMEDVAVERWGSLSKLVSMIEEAEARMKHHSSSRFNSNSYKEDFRERPSSKSFREPSRSDRSPSPKKSFRFEKPKDYDRNRKKIGKFNSSEMKKRHTSYSNEMEDSPGSLKLSPDRNINENNSASENFQKFHRSSDRSKDCSTWKKPPRDSSSDLPKSYPAWKKPPRDSSNDLSKDYPAWKKSHRDSSTEKSGESSYKKSHRDLSSERSGESSYKKSHRNSSSERSTSESSWKKSRDLSPDRSSSNYTIPQSPGEPSISKQDIETEWKKPSEDLVPNCSKYDASLKETDYSLDDETSDPYAAGTSGESSFIKSLSSDTHRSPTLSKRMEFTSMEIHTEDDLNRLASAFLRAELSGDTALAAELKTRFDDASEAFESGEKGFVSLPTVRTTERVLLTKMDSSGQQRPIQASREDAGFERRSGHKKTVNKYFDDGSKYSLKQMFEREKLTTTEDNLEMFLDVAAESKGSDDENETSGISRKASHKMSHGVQEEKDIGKAMQQHQKRRAALEKCEYCLDSPNMKRHLIVTIRDQVYMCLPNYQYLTEGHCLIVPKKHVPSFLALDEEEWAEVEELKSLIRNMFRKQQKSLLCLETSMSFGKCLHAFIECIPVPEEEGHMAPMYFKKAILESEEEWAHNVKLVDLTKKGLRYSVPKNLPYFCILFDPSIHAGFAHVIEDEKYFPRNFGKEIIGGMLDIDYNHLYKNKKEDPIKKSHEALLFIRSLEDFTGEDL